MGVFKNKENLFFLFVHDFDKYQDILTIFFKINAVNTRWQIYFSTDLKSSHERDV